MVRFKQELNERVQIVVDYIICWIMMVDMQVCFLDVMKFLIIDVMFLVLCEVYVFDDQKEVVYVGENFVLVDDCVILELCIFVKFFDILDIQLNEVVLDLGVGLGYLIVVLVYIVDFVVGVEVYFELVIDVQVILLEQGVDNVVIMEGLLNEGVEKFGFYDVVIL